MSHKIGGFIVLCPKCNGILDVIKIHNVDSIEPRLCDVQCLECGEVVNYQPYDWGTRLNVVSSKNEKTD